MSWAAVGLNILGLGSSILGGLDAKDAAEEAGEKQAAIIRATAAENERRRKLDLGQQLGGITAAVGASNLQMSGSSKRYRTAFEANARSEMAWDKQKARMDARLALKTGRAAGSSAMYQGIGSATRFASQAFAAAPSYLGKKTGVG